MPSLADLFERLADDGDVEGFDAVFSSAVDALGVGPSVVEMTPHRPRRRAGWVALVAACVATVIVVPLVVTHRGAPRTTARVSVTTRPAPDRGDVLPNVASATAAQLRTWVWSQATPPPTIQHPDLVVWDGREVLVSAITRIFVGPSAESSQAVRATWGYDPSADTWTRLPSPQLNDRIDAAVWTGREVLVWSAPMVTASPTSNGVYADGAAFDPATRRWTAVSAPPSMCPMSSGSGADAQPVWTGTEVVLFGIDGGRNCTPTTATVVRAYDVATDAWSAMPAFTSGSAAEHDYQATVIGLTNRSNTLGRELRHAYEAYGNCGKDRACLVRSRATIEDLHNAWLDTKKQLDRAQHSGAPPGTTEGPTAISAAFTRGRVVAAVVWATIENHPASFSESTRVYTWKPGANGWTPLVYDGIFGPALVVRGALAIPPGSPCLPNASCLSSSAAAGRLLDLTSHTETTIVAPPSTSPNIVGATVSTGAALVVAWSPEAERCPSGGCPTAVSAWDPGTRAWVALPSPPPRAMGSSYVWTGHALVAISTIDTFKVSALRPAP